MQYKAFYIFPPGLFNSFRRVGKDLKDVMITEQQKRIDLLEGSNKSLRGWETKRNKFKKQ